MTASAAISCLWTNSFKREELKVINNLGSSIGVSIISESEIFTNNVVNRSLDNYTKSAYAVFLPAIENSSIGSDAFMERIVLDMEAKYDIDREIKNIAKFRKNFHLVLFMISLIAAVSLSLSSSIEYSVAIVLKPFSIALPLMIAISYWVWKVR